VAESKRFLAFQSIEVTDGDDHLDSSTLIK